MIDAVDEHNTIVLPIMKSILSADGEMLRLPPDALVILESVITGVCLTISTNAVSHLPATDLADLVAAGVKARIQTILDQARAEIKERAN